jgi:hypothetical protein
LNLLGGHGALQNWVIGAPNPDTIHSFRPSAESAGQGKAHSPLRPPDRASHCVTRLTDPKTFPAVAAQLTDEPACQIGSCPPSPSTVEMCHPQETPSRCRARRWQGSNQRRDRGVTLLDRHFRSYTFLLAATNLGRGAAPAPRLLAKYPPCLIGVYTLSRPVGIRYGILFAPGRSRWGPTGMCWSRAGVLRS